MPDWKYSEGERKIKLSGIMGCCLKKVENKPQE